jgi:hypothetical protein
MSALRQRTVRPADDWLHLGTIEPLGDYRETSHAAPIGAIFFSMAAASVNALATAGERRHCARTDPTIAAK